MNITNNLTEYVKHLEEIKQNILGYLEKCSSLCQYTNKYNLYKTKFLRNIDIIDILEKEIYLYINFEKNDDIYVTNDLLEEKKYFKNMIGFIEQIININALVVDIKAHFVLKDYIKASNSIMELKKISEMSQHDIKQLKGHFIDRNSKLEEKLLTDLNELFHINYKWEINHDYCKLTILDFKSISTVLLALNNCNYLDQYAFEFADKIFNYILEPIFSKGTVICNEKMFVLLNYIDEHNYDEVSILIKFFSFFQSHMQTDGEKLFYQKVGNFMSERLVDILIEKLYKSVIRKSKNNHPHAVHEYLEIQTLEKICKDITFIIDNDKRLNFYNRSIHELFIEERCKDILFECQVLISGQIFKYIHSSDLKLLCNTIIVTEEVKFESCIISEMMGDLINNCYLLLNESKKEMGSNVMKYHKFILHIINLYQFLAPIKHEKSIQSLPIVAALFYNDCMFFSYHILLIQMMMNEMNDSKQHQLLSQQVKHIRMVGLKNILKFVALKKVEIFQCIDFNGFQNAIGKVLINGFQRVSLLLIHLHKVWVEVLPLNITQKFIGVLLNAVFQMFCVSIISLEDICQSDGIKLIEIIENLFSLAFQLVDSSLVPVLIPKSTKLQEIKFVITANLNEINDRWASGYGPLAHQLKVPELEALVKALFQNTNRRADLLASIK